MKTYTYTNQDPLSENDSKPLKTIKKKTRRLSCNTGHLQIQHAHIQAHLNKPLTCPPESFETG